MLVDMVNSLDLFATCLIIILLCAGDSICRETATWTECLHCTHSWGNNVHGFSPLKALCFISARRQAKELKSVLRHIWITKSLNPSGNALSLFHGCWPESREHEESTMALTRTSTSQPRERDAPSIVQVSTCMSDPISSSAETEWSQTLRVLLPRTTRILRRALKTPWCWRNQEAGIPSYQCVRRVRTCFRRRSDQLWDLDLNKMNLTGTHGFTSPSHGSRAESPGKDCSWEYLCASNAMAMTLQCYGVRGERWIFEIGAIVWRLVSSPTPGSDWLSLLRRMEKDALFDSLKWLEK